MVDEDPRRRPDRRGVLRAAGMVGAGGIGAVVAAPAPALAHQQPWQVIDVKQHGALGDGTTDDWAAIQAALDEVGTANATPNVVYFPAGDYVVSKPLVPRTNTMMVGTHTVDYVADANPVSQCKIRARSNFSGAGLVMPPASTTGLTIRDLALVGNDVGTSVCGLRLPDWGSVTTEQGLSLQGVTIGGFSGDGIAGSMAAASLEHCHISRNKGWGINASGGASAALGNRWVDVHVADCFVYFNWTGNILFGGPGESGQVEIVNTRIERAGGDPANVARPRNASAPGLRITGAHTVRLTNCSTDANMGNGVEIVRDGSSPASVPHHIQLVNCLFLRDGTGDQAALLDYAGLKVVGTGTAGTSAVNDVSAVGCVVGTGRADDRSTQSILGPKYGVWYDNTTHFQWIGGDASGVVTDHHTGTGGNWEPTIVDIKHGLLTLPTVAPNGTTTIPEGAAYVDPATSRLRVRIGGTWKSVTLA